MFVTYMPTPMKAVKSKKEVARTRYWSRPSMSTVMSFPHTKAALRYSTLPLEDQPKARPASPNVLALRYVGSTRSPVNRSVIAFTLF